MATDIRMVDAAPPDADGKLPIPADVERWTQKDVLAYTPIKNILEDPEDEATFTRARIDGKAFLLAGNNEDFWWCRCKLPPGPSVKLADLVQRIKNSATEAERIDEEEQRIAKEAARDEVFKKLHSRIQRVSCNVSEYCDPNQKQLLPFPFPYPVPARFKVDDDGYFEFYGRSKFRELYEVAHSMNRRVNPRYFFHGTLGAGKSHLLAALACLLMREGKIVVYVPDCTELLADPQEYFCTALELAYDGSVHSRRHLKGLRREDGDELVALERLKHFCRLVATPSNPALFIVDQANALDGEPIVESQQFSNDKKKQVRTLLDASTASHLKLESSTANYKHAWTNSLRQRSEKRISLYCGLDEEEMEAWWATNEKKLTDRLRPSDPFQQLEKDYLEELTGRMPILLQALATVPLATVPVENSSKGADIAINVNASSNISSNIPCFPTRLTLLHDLLFKSTEVRALIGNMTQFWTDHEESLTEDLKYKYWDVVLACLTCDTVDRSALGLLDWRYFYVDDDECGHTTCGVVRLAAGVLLRRVKNINHFRDPVWVTKMEMSGRNPVVLGFHVEQLTLLQIFRRGCLVAGSEFGETRKVEEFEKTMPPAPGQDFEGAILFLPAAFNFRAVDGILVYQEKEKKKVVVVGIQITIAARHSDSETNFINCWKHWESLMQCENIEFRFLWILENRGNRKEKIVVPAKTRELKGRTIVVTPQYTSIETTVKEVDKAIGRSLERAREYAW